MVKKPKLPPPSPNGPPSRLVVTWGGGGMSPLIPWLMEPSRSIALYTTSWTDHEGLVHYGPYIPELIQNQRANIEGVPQTDVFGGAARLGGGWKFMKPDLFSSVGSLIRDNMMTRARPGIILRTFLAKLEKQPTYPERDGVIN